MHPLPYAGMIHYMPHWVREKGVLPLHTAIRKMTSFPAARFGLHDRGLIRPGMMADIVVFDAEEVANRATYREPHRYPAGFHAVLVNGQVALRRGELTDARAGRLLRG